MENQTPVGDGPVPPAAPPPGPPGTATGHATGFFAQLRGLGLYRSEERWIGGVAGGIAARFGLDPLLVRGLFLVTLLLGGFGLAVYAVAWALLPEQRDGRIHLEGLTLGHPDIALLGALVMFVGGVSRGAFNDYPLRVPGWLQGMFWFGAVVVIVVLIATLASRRPARVPPGPVPQAPPVPPAMPFTGPAAPRPAAPHPAAGTTSPAAPLSQGAPITMSVPPTAPYQPAPPTQPYHYAPPPRPPMPAPIPVAPKPARRGPGSTVVGVAVALSLFVIAGVLIAQRAGWLDRSTVATGAALIVVILGVAIVVSGLRGRTSGVLGFLAVVAMLAAIPITLVSRADWDNWRTAPNALHASAGTTVIDSRAEAERGIRIGAGEAVVDLSDVPLTAETLVVPISLGTGDFTIVLPEGVEASGSVSIGAGQVRWNVGDDDETWSGILIDKQNFGVPADEAQLRIQVGVGAGNVTIEEE